MNKNARNILIIAGLGGLAWYLFVRGKGAAISNTLSTTLNPLSDQNIAYTTASSLATKMTGDAVPLGTQIFDAAHTQVPGALPGVQMLNPLMLLNPITAPTAVASDAEALAEQGWQKLQQGTSWLASLLNIASFM